MSIHLTPSVVAPATAYIIATLAQHLVDCPTTDRTTAESMESFNLISQFNSLRIITYA
ncbi:hypothetical protein N0485_004797 [Escherichia coli]|nr:hypothetical protein [Salmonella enterica]EER6426824.1 hypothetical protein [Escherichia coli]EEV1142128.1 hypothetical protein [Escherichia coli O157:H7]EHE7437234.1 hypothetical protein [Salmonella enterica subsp. enterica serovar Michigan]EHG0170502.1 hypothetical protein [Salmonella enterica subsp. enterica serovar Newport]EHY5314519.1 hypothetical protein [Salmonella enterica subsp. enterica serovar Enteritidis]EMC4018627.1 hypothetical protein [Salmonella enterica subsp. enterica ser